MPRRKKKTTKQRPVGGTKNNPRVFEACGGGGCSIDRRAIKTMEPATFPGFDYTTPSAINPASPIKPRTRGQRKKMGCNFRRVSYTGKGGVQRFKEIVADPRPECQDSGTPCPPTSKAMEKKGKIRNTCPVQLIFREGEMMLRFCRKPKKPGYVRRVASIEEAQRLAASACHCWERNGQSFEKCLDRTGKQLGRISRRRSRKARR